VEPGILIEEKIALSLLERRIRGIDNASLDIAVKDVYSKHIVRMNAVQFSSFVSVSGVLSVGSC